MEKEDARKLIKERLQFILGPLVTESIHRNIADETFLAEMKTVFDYKTTFADALATTVLEFLETQEADGLDLVRSSLNRDIRESKQLEKKILDFVTGSFSIAKMADSDNKVIKQLLKDPAFVTSFDSKLEKLICSDICMPKAFLTVFPNYMYWTESQREKHEIETLIVLPAGDDAYCYIFCCLDKQGRCYDKREFIPNHESFLGIIFPDGVLNNLVVNESVFKGYLVMTGLFDSGVSLIETTARNASNSALCFNAELHVRAKVRHTHVTRDEMIIDMYIKAMKSDLE